MVDWWNLYALKIGKVKDENGEEWVRAVFSNAAEGEYATDKELAFAIEALFHILQNTNNEMAKAIREHVMKSPKNRCKEMKRLFDELCNE